MGKATAPDWANLCLNSRTPPISAFSFSCFSCSNSKSLARKYFRHISLFWELGPFILTLDDDARRNVGHADGGTRLVDVLAAGTGGL